jgi:hypothetical protein
MKFCFHPLETLISSITDTEEDDGSMRGKTGRMMDESGRDGQEQEEEMNRKRWTKKEEDGTMDKEEER